jgi:O-antigen ligase
MKQLFLIDDTTVNKISYYHLVCFLVALPFDFFYSEIILISFGIHTLIHLQKAKSKRIITKPVLLLISIYLLGLAAILYSPDKTEAVNVVGRQLAILIFPILFVLTDLNLQKYKLNLICIFGFTCTSTILYLFADAVYTILYFHIPLSTLFTGLFMNHKFALPVQMHATYLSLYATFSLLVFIYFILSKGYAGQKWIYVISAVILSAGMLQLSSRAVFIAFLVVFNLVFPFILYKGKKRVLFFAMASLISVVALIAIFNMNSFRERYISELKTDLTDNGKIIENIEPRLARWDATIELIKKSPVFGYGSGSEKELLKEMYFEKKLFISYLHEFNAHNEYLSFLIKTGIIGLALLIYVLYFGFTTAIQNRDIPFLVFLVLISVVFISENILDLNKGVFFYSFFFSLFLLSSKVYEANNSNILNSKSGNLM